MCTIGVAPINDLKMTLQHSAGCPQLAIAETVPTAMPSEMASSSSRGASEEAEVPDGYFEEEFYDEYDELLAPSSPSKSARRRMRRRRQRETLKINAPCISVLPQVSRAEGALARPDMPKDFSARATVTLGDLGFELAAPPGARRSAYSMPLAPAPRATAPQQPVPFGRFAAPTQTCSGMQASVVGQLGLDTFHGQPGSTTASSTPSECSEVSFCPMTATAQLWIPVKPSVYQPTSPCHTPGTGVMSTGLYSGKIEPGDSASGSHAVGDASSRIPCATPDARTLYGPVSESLAAHALGGHTYGVPEAYEFIAFGGTRVDIQPTQPAATDALQLLLPFGAAQPQHDLVAQLRAAAPEVYED